MLFIGVALAAYWGMNRFIAFTAIFLLAGCAAKPAAVPAPATAVPLPPAPPKGEVTGVTNLTAASLRATYGTPAFVRKDNGAEIWRYDGPACRAFFFLYTEGAQQVVRHAETLPRGADIAADATCLAALRAKPAS